SKVFIIDLLLVRTAIYRSFNLGAWFPAFLGVPFTPTWQPSRSALGQNSRPQCPIFRHVHFLASAYATTSSTSCFGYRGLPAIGRTVMHATVNKCQHYVVPRSSLGFFNG